MKREGFLRFFLLLLVSALLIFLLRNLLGFLLSTIDLPSYLKLILYWLFFTGITLFSVVLSYYAINYVYPVNSHTVANEKDSLTLTPVSHKSSSLRESELFSGFKFTNFGKQIRDGLLLLCIVYTPLDFISYLIPGVLQFSADLLQATKSDDPENYFIFSPILMLIVTLCIHCCVALREEFVYRGVFLTYGSKQLSKSAAFIASVVMFGLAHFNYFFSAGAKNMSIFFSFWWGCNAVVIGITAALYYDVNKKIFPIIIAHFLNNVISAYSVRFFALGRPFWTSSGLFLYLPIIVFGAVSLIVSKRIRCVAKEHINHFKNLMRDYKDGHEEKKDYLIDIVFFLILWFLTFFI